MVVHWKRAPEEGSSRRLAINAFGAVVTGIVFCVVVSTKFLSGAWIVVSAIPVLIFLMWSIRAHYSDVADQLAHPDRRPPDRRAGNHSMVILVERVDAASARAVGYVRMVRPRNVSAVTFDRTNAAAFRRLAPEIPLTILKRNGSEAETIKAHLHGERKKLPPDDFFSLVIPELLKRRGLWEILRRPRIHRLKASFLPERGVQIVDLPIFRDDVDPDRDEAQEPARNDVVVLVSGVHNATLQALEYAETFDPTDLRAVSFGLDPESTEKLAQQWLLYEVQAPLELHESPYRDIGRSLVDYIHRFRPDGTSRVVTVVIPEFVVRKAPHQFLHGQTALLVKRHLLFEPGVVVASVPYHLED